MEMDKLEEIVVRLLRDRMSFEFIKESTGIGKEEAMKICYKRDEELYHHIKAEMDETSKRIEKDEEER